MTAAWSFTLLVDRTNLVVGFFAGMALTLLVGWVVWEFLRWFEDREMAPPPMPRRPEAERPARRVLFDIRHGNDFEAWEDELK